MLNIPEIERINLAATACHAIKNRGVYAIIGRDNSSEKSVDVSHFLHICDEVQDVGKMFKFCVLCEMGYSLNFYDYPVYAVHGLLCTDDTKLPHNDMPFLFQCHKHRFMLSFQFNVSTSKILTFVGIKEWNEVACKISEGEMYTDDMIEPIRLSVSADFEFENYSAIDVKDVEKSIDRLIVKVTDDHSAFLLRLPNKRCAIIANDMLLGKRNETLIEYLKEYGVTLEDYEQHSQHMNVVVLDDVSARSKYEKAKNQNLMVSIGSQQDNLLDDECKAIVRDKFKPRFTLDFSHHAIMKDVYLRLKTVLIWQMNLFKFHYMQVWDDRDELESLTTDFFVKCFEFVYNDAQIEKELQRKCYLQKLMYDPILKHGSGEPTKHVFPSNYFVKEYVPMIKSTHTKVQPKNQPSTGPKIDQLRCPPDNLIFSIHNELTAKFNLSDEDYDIATTCGKYGYYHYRQRGFNDDGWGCAYRSLQTIMSWLLHNGTPHPDAVVVPEGCEPLNDVSLVYSHTDIQKLLVYNVMDKDASFIGSKQWIGSFEISWVLETGLRIESRILQGANGLALSEDAIVNELFAHFSGAFPCPVMIGGGKLAHTILGVAKPKVAAATMTEDAFLDSLLGSDMQKAPTAAPQKGKSSSSVHYLVLDPHFTGGDDNLQAIFKGGWCGWKNSDEFWSKTDFYRLCVPKGTCAM